MVHPHLKHSSPVLRTRLQQGERQANMVVQVSPGRNHAPVHRQNRPAKILGACFSVAARDPDHLERKRPPVGASHLLEPNQRVQHTDKAHSGHRAATVLGVHQRTRRPGRSRCGQVAVSVKTFSAQCHEKIASLNGPRIGADPAANGQRVARCDRPTRPIRKLLEVCGGHASSSTVLSSTARRATETSLKGMLTP